MASVLLLLVFIEIFFDLYKLWYFMDGVDGLQSHLPRSGGGGLRKSIEQLQRLALFRHVMTFRIHFFKSYNFAKFIFHFVNCDPSTLILFFRFG